MSHMRKSQQSPGFLARCARSHSHGIIPRAFCNGVKKEREKEHCQSAHDAQKEGDGGYTGAASSRRRFYEDIIAAKRDFLQCSRAPELRRKSLHASKTLGKKKKRRTIVLGAMPTNDRLIAALLSSRECFFALSFYCYDDVCGNDNCAHCKRRVFYFFLRAH